MAKQPTRRDDFSVTPELIELVDLVQVTPGYKLKISLDRQTSAPGTHGLGYVFSFSDPSGFKSKSFTNAAEALDWFRARLDAEMPAAA